MGIQNFFSDIFPLPQLDFPSLTEETTSHALPYYLTVGITRALCFVSFVTLGKLHSMQSYTRNCGGGGGASQGLPKASPDIREAAIEKG